jgi:hypothetical protein
MERPQAGGSYERQKDGKLKCIRKPAGSPKFGEQRRIKFEKWKRERKNAPPVELPHEKPAAAQDQPKKGGD